MRIAASRSLVLNGEYAKVPVGADKRLKRASKGCKMRGSLDARYLV